MIFIWYLFMEGSCGQVNNYWEEIHRGEQERLQDYTQTHWLSTRSWIPCIKQYNDKPHFHIIIQWSPWHKAFCHPQSSAVSVCSYYRHTLTTEGGVLPLVVHWPDPWALSQCWGLCTIRPCITVSQWLNCMMLTLRLVCTVVSLTSHWQRCRIAKWRVIGIMFLKPLLGGGLHSYRAYVTHQRLSRCCDGYLARSDLHNVHSNQ